MSAIYPFQTGKPASFRRQYYVIYTGHVSLKLHVPRLLVNNVLSDVNADCKEDVPWSIPTIRGKLS